MCRPQLSHLPRLSLCRRPNTGPSRSALHSSLNHALTQWAQAIHESATPFSPIIPTAALPYIALVLLTATFGLGFYFTILPKATIPAREAGVALLASILAGFGTVALFCTVGVYV
ncbi:hypothetical protein BKA62DRAFT_616584 [Auriculariales sp. MPI-PUGE-AT-0066]|nr:hypothetical protein BKA62DRAFT_616584 [Auriculariales sp. MPI-PUGE-AT-0066]